VQYIAVLSGYGVDAAFEQDMLNALIEKPRIVPQGGVLWVFRLAEEF
jgi:alcohol dehydrogenase (cytochrome c)